MLYRYWSCCTLKIQLPPYPRTVSLLHNIATGTAVCLAIYRQGMRAGQAHNTPVRNTLSKIGKLRSSLQQNNTLAISLALIVQLKIPLVICLSVIVQLNTTLAISVALIVQQNTTPAISCLAVFLQLNTTPVISLVVIEEQNTNLAISLAVLEELKPLLPSVWQ